MNEELTKAWQAIVDEAAAALSGDCPLACDADILAVDAYIRTLEIRLGIRKDKE